MDTFPRDRAGFTLIELLVSITVGAVVLLAVQAAIGLVVDRTEGRQGREAVEEALRVEAARLALRRWLQGVPHPAPEDTAAFAGADLTRAGRPADEVRFASLDPGATGEAPGTPLRMRLRVAERGLVLDFAPADHRAPVRVLELLPEVGGLDVRYLDTDTARSWRPLWPAQARVPLAVELRFHPRPGRSLPDGLRPPLRVVLGDGRGRVEAPSPTADSVRPPEDAGREWRRSRRRRER